MGYTEDDLVLFEPVFDASQRQGTAYFEFHPAELPEPNAFWLPGSLLLRDAAFDFFAECFYRTRESFDYFSVVRLGSGDIKRLIDELTIYLTVLRAGPTREQLFSNYVSIVSADIWSAVPTQPLADAVLNAGRILRWFVRSETKETACLWVVGM